MAKVIAVIEAFKPLADAEAQLNLHRNPDPNGFPEWRDRLPDLSPSDRDRLPYNQKLATPTSTPRGSPLCPAATYTMTA